MNTTFGEVMANPKSRKIFEDLTKESKVGGNLNAMTDNQDGDAAISKEMVAAMMEGMPLRSITMFVPGMEPEAVEKLIDALNKNRT